MVLSRPGLSSEVLLKSRSELQLCCALCGAEPDAARQLLERQQDGIDWMALVEAARTYRLEMLLHRAVESHFADVVSAPAREALRKAYADNRARGQTLTVPLLRLIQRLAAEQIPALPFKGPALGAQFFGDIALRMYADLDVLVRACDIDRVAAIMRALGYTEALEMSLSWERSFALPSGESVDVHWSIAEKTHQFPLTAEELWARRTTIDLAGTPVPTLCAEDALLAVCFNGLTEDWQRCDRIADVAEVLRSGSVIDWEAFLESCRRRGCERLLLVGLHLAKELFGARLPSCAERRLQSHHSALVRAGYGFDTFMDFMVTSTDRRGGFDYWRHVFRMRERQWERIPYYQSFAYGLFKPKADDAPWQRASREVLYRVLRVPLLGVKQGLRALGHANLKETDTRP